MCENRDLGDSSVNADSVGTKDSGQKNVGHRAHFTYVCKSAERGLSSWCSIVGFSRVCG